MSLYTTTALALALTAMDRPQAFLRDTFFPNNIFSETEEIAIDKLLTRKKMAPFVSPDVPAKERAIRGRKVETFAPATLKPMGTVRPGGLLKRAHGEEFGANPAPADRKLGAINQLLSDQDDEITRREEWMCSHALRSGIVTVSGEDYETQIVDYGRDPEQTIILLGASRWGEPGVSIFDDISDWSTLVQTKSGGVVTRIVLGSGAARLFQKDDEVKEALNNRRQSDGVLQFGPVATGGEDNHAAYLGSIGQFDFYTYSQFFENDDGSQFEVWPEFGVGVVAQNVFAGNMAYGAILEMDVLLAVSRYPKNFETQNPSREHIITHSAPLPVPAEIAGSLFALVR